MKVKNIMKPLMVLTSLIFFCIGFFFVGWHTGYNSGRASAEAKTEPIAAIEMRQQEQPQSKQENEVLVSIGDFTLSAYCSCVDCCGKNDGITATGAKVQQGVTIAVDPTVIPYGTTIVINGN